MKISNELYRLIHSLTQNEKRHFSLHASLQTGGEKNNYLALFDVLERQQNFEAAAKVLQKSKKAAWKKNFPLIQQYLYKNLLKSLEQSNSHKYIDLRLSHLLNQCRMLYHRGLVQQCLNWLRKTAALAQRYERFLILYQVYELETSLHINYSVEGLNETIQELHDKRQYCLQQQAIQEQLFLLKMQIFTFSKKSLQVRNEQEQEYLYRLKLQMAVFEEENSERFSFYARIHLLSFNGVYYFLMGDYQSSFQASHQALQLWQQQPHFITEDLYLYLGVINSFLLCSPFLGAYQAMEECLETLQKIESNHNKDLQLRQFLIYHIHSFVLLTQTHHYTKALDLLHATQSGLERDGAKVGFEWKLRFKVMFANVLFINQRYNEALDEVSDILEMNAKGYREDLNVSTRMLQLLLHLQLGNELLLDSLLRNTYEGLRKHAQLYELERTFLRYIKKYLHASLSSDKLRKADEQLLKALKILEKNPFFEKALYYYDWIYWLEQRIAAIAAVHKK